MDIQDELPDIMINLLLAINLQFDDFTDNIVMDAMHEIASGKTFTEKILILLNREGKPYLEMICIVFLNNFVSRGSIKYFRTYKTSS